MKSITYTDDTKLSMLKFNQKCNISEYNIMVNAVAVMHFNSERLIGSDVTSALAFLHITIVNRFTTYLLTEFMFCL